MARKDDGDDWIEEVADALSGLGLFDASTRESLVQGVREALRDSNPDKRPDVMVLPGGRADHDERSPSEPPELRVVEGHGDPGTDDGADDDTAERPPFTLKVVRLARETLRPRLRGRPSDEVPEATRLHEAPPDGRASPAHADAIGRISLPALDDPVDDVWQTILHAIRPATYRIHCDEGELHVAVDGELAVRIEARQTSDVEGKVIRVRAPGSRGATGRYSRIG